MPSVSASAHKSAHNVVLHLSRSSLAHPHALALGTTASALAFALARARRLLLRAAKGARGKLGHVARALLDCMLGNLIPTAIE